MPGLADFGANPQAPEFGGCGVVYVRWGKASKGSAPKRRSVLTVLPWSARVLGQWAGQFRGLFGQAAGGGGVLWPGDRSARVSLEKVGARFAGSRDALGLPGCVSLRSLRHSYITHLIEDGYDPRSRSSGPGTATPGPPPCTRRCRRISATGRCGRRWTGPSVPPSAAPRAAKGER